MEKTPENMAWIAGKLVLFMDYPGAPKTDEAFKDRCERVLKFLNNKPISGANGRTCHDKRGNEIDSVALFDWIGDELKFFPATVEMRQYLSRFFPAADGLQVATEESDEE